MRCIAVLLCNERNLKSHGQDTQNQFHSKTKQIDVLSISAKELVITSMYVCVYVCPPPGRCLHTSVLQCIRTSRLRDKKMKGSQTVV